VLALHRKIQRKGDLLQKYLGIWATCSFLGIYIGSQLTPNMLEHTFWFLLGYLTALATSASQTT